MTSLHLLTVPGYTGSGPRHWQSLWESADPSMRRVEQENWDEPDVEAWPAAIERDVRRLGGPAVLVAHSCGVVAVALWAARYDTTVAGAFLVAPPDFGRPDLEEPIRRFRPGALRPLPFPAVLVASENDPCCAFDRSQTFAAAWGARLVSAGAAGHLNTASGHGPWPEGRRLLGEFTAAF